MRAKTRLSGNPWIRRLEELTDPEVLRRRLFRRPESLTERIERTGEPPAEAIGPLLKEIYVPSESGCKIVLRLIDRLRAALAERFPDAKTYLRRMYLEDFGTDELAQVICLTGPSGVGKSQLVSAFVRLVGSPTPFWLGAEHQSVLIECVRRVKIGPRTTDAMIYGALSNPAYANDREAYSRGAALKHVPQWLYNCGVGLLLVDEMQFLTQSSQANTRVTQVLLTLGYLGPSMVFVSNYSLGHRLKKRNDEERQRLLGEPIVYEPEGHDSVFWQCLIAEYVRVAPRMLKLCPDRDGWRLWVLTGGLPRLLCHLIVTAAREHVDARTGEVTMAAVERAYLSEAYSAQRETVEAMCSLALSPGLAAHRPDLVCPFKRQSHYAEHVRKARDHLKPPSPWDAPPGVSVGPPAAAQRLIESTLSPEAKKALRQLRVGNEKTQGSERRKTSVRSPRRGSKVTEETLFAGARALRKLSARKGGRSSDGDDESS